MSRDSAWAVNGIVHCMLLITSTLGYAARFSRAPRLSDYQISPFVQEKQHTEVAQRKQAFQSTQSAFLSDPGTKTLPVKCPEFTRPAARLRADVTADPCGVYSGVARSGDHLFLAEERRTNLSTSLLSR